MSVDDDGCPHAFDIQQPHRFKNFIRKYNRYLVGIHDLRYFYMLFSSPILSVPSIILRMNKQKVLELTDRTPPSHGHLKPGERLPRLNSSQVN